MNNLKLKTSLLGILLTICGYAQENVINIIPQPVSIEMKKGYFILDEKVKILAMKEQSKAYSFLQEYLLKHYKRNLKTSSNNQGKIIALAIKDNFTNEPLIKGAYRIDVREKDVYIIGDDSEGIFNGVMSFIQLLPLNEPKSIQIPYCTIKDAPRFAYRGLHLDCGRHFWSVDFIKKYIDYIALHKMNYFHWHLTEDQGWRIEIKKYPKLTSVGGWRNGTIIGRYPGTGNDGIKYGGFYTQEQIKEIVKYATDRYITVIPEIEMPGHSSAAIAAYPELSCFPDKSTEYPKQCAWSGPTAGKQVQQTWGVFDDVFCAGKENTFKFLEDVMEEVLALFPSKYIHVGGDESPKAHWELCPACQQRIKDNKLKDEHELQSYFIQRMEKYLNKKGRTLIGWDEILEGGLAPNAVVMSWRGEAGGIEAAKQNHDVIMTPGNPVYFDHTQSENEDSVTIGGYNPIEKVYAYEPVPKELNDEQAKHILGAQANMWTEYMKNTNKVEYMLFPRIAALSEVLWIQKEKKNWSDFEKRLMVQFKRYDLWKVNYSKAYFDLKTTVLPSENFDGVNWTISHGFDKGLLVFRCFENFIGKDTQAVYTASHPTNFLKYEVHDSPWWRIHKQVSSSTGKFLIKKEGQYSITNYKIRPESQEEMLLDPNYPIISLKQSFYFNIATGKKITLEKQASNKYPGDGPFTLVNGVQNEKGMSKTKEFLGFSGDDCIATIDLGKTASVSFVKVHYLHHPGSWIHQPSSVVISVSMGGKDFTTVALSNLTIANNEVIGKLTQSVNARFIKIHVANAGVIPSGNPGAGSKAWLFVDEIQVN